MTLTTRHNIFYLFGFLFIVCVVRFTETRSVFVCIPQKKYIVVAVNVKIARI